LLSKSKARKKWEKFVTKRRRARLGHLGSFLESLKKRESCWAGEEGGGKRA